MSERHSRAHWNVWQTEDGSPQFGSPPPVLLLIDLPAGIPLIEDLVTLLPPV